MAIIIDTDVVTKAAVPRRSLIASRREAIWGYVFISPWLIGLALFTAIPIAASLVLSMTDFNLLKPEGIHFVFLNNYLWAASDPTTGTSFLVTLKFAVEKVPP